MPSYNKDYLTTTSDGLGAAPTARARHHSYNLLSQIFLSGVTKDIVPAVQAVPELAGQLPSPLDFDETAAAHYQLFGFNIFPFESIFVAESGLLGGRAASAVARSYQQIGFAEATTGESPDHIGHELAALAYLSGVEANALAGRAPETADSLRRQQLGFLESHLLRWLSPFVLAVKAQKDEFYTAVVDLLLAFVTDHYQSLVAYPVPAQVTWALPAPPDLLDDGKTGLKDIALFLTRPAFCGLFISRDDVARLAQGLDLPRGFGDRQQLLSNLMRSAVQYDKFTLLLETYRALSMSWQTAYGRQAGEMPLLEPFLRPWQERVELSLRLLAQMVDQLGAAE